MNSDGNTLNESFALLQQFAQRRNDPLEQCELCAKEIPSQHPHLVEPESRRIVCSCDACAVLFPGRPNARYRRVPRDARSIPDFQMTDGQWESLLIPINMAFFLDSTPAERVVTMYPSPAGPTESLLSFESWSELVDANLVLESMQPDVEALLINRLGHTYGFIEHEYYLAPIDQCYGLAGLIRTCWKGLSGGTEAWKHIRHFFRELKRRARPVQEPPNA